jgi:hypothetical protein
MPVWTHRCNRDLDAVILARGLRVLARDDPQVVSVSMTYEVSTESWTFRVDTGDNPRPLNEELWEFLRTHSNQEFTQQPVVGFERLYLGEFMPLEEPNQNGDILPQRIQEQILSRYLANPEGRASLGRSMAAPIRARRDYTSVARRVFMVDQLPEGALPFFGPHSVHIPAWMVPGVWMENIETGIVAQIFSVNEDVSSVTLDGWRTDERIVIDLRGFNPEAWRVILEPKEGLPWYERLDELV